MNSVIEKLAEVEETAEAIVEHARQQKSEIEKQIQEERSAYEKNFRKRFIWSISYDYQYASCSDECIRF